MQNLNFCRKKAGLLEHSYLVKYPLDYLPHTKIGMNIIKKIAYVLCYGQQATHSKTLMLCLCWPASSKVGPGYHPCAHN